MANEFFRQKTYTQESRFTSAALGPFEGAPKAAAKLAAKGGKKVANGTLDLSIRAAKATVEKAPVVMDFGRGVVRGGMERENRPMSTLLLIIALVLAYGKYKNLDLSSPLPDVDGNNAAVGFFQFQQPDPENCVEIELGQTALGALSTTSFKGGPDDVLRVTRKADGSVDEATFGQIFAGDPVAAPLDHVDPGDLACGIAK